MAGEADVRAAFRRQAAACERLGSAFTARLCLLATTNLKSSSAVGRTILGWNSDPSASGDALPLRLAGALHALVLGRHDPDLMQVYPPHQSSDDVLWAAVLSAFGGHEKFILQRLRSAPQTNEIRRSSALLAGFLTIAELFDRPMILSEIGASAGLNLQWDRYHHRIGDLDWGDPAATVGLRPEWQGAEPADTAIRIANRAGCDLNPLDPSSPEDRLRLLSYIWADQTDRLERTRAALAIARSEPLQVDRADAVLWLEQRLADPAPDHVHVIYHSIAWQYLPPAAKTAGEEIIASAGRKATQSAPIARLQMEADDNPDGAALTLQIWPSGEKRELGRADFHGRWIKWQGWQR